MVFLNSSLYFVGLFLLDMCVFPFCFFLSLILTHLSTFLGYIQYQKENVSEHKEEKAVSGAEKNFRSSWPEVGEDKYVHTVKSSRAEKWSPATSKKARKETMQTKIQSPLVTEWVI